MSDGYSKQPKSIPSLDGIRAIAVLLVVCRDFQCFRSYAPDSVEDDEFLLGGAMQSRSNSLRQVVVDH